MARFVLVVGMALTLLSCAKAPEAVDEPVAESPLEGAGGASGDEAVEGNALTGLPGIDNGRVLIAQILDARGTGRQGGMSIPSGSARPLLLDSWMLTDAGSEYEISMRSALVPDAIVRLSGQAAFLVQTPLGQNPVPRFKLFGGQATFYLMNLPDQAVIDTPAGPLVTTSASFTVTISPDSQVLVTCRDGAVYLSGTQNAVALPGQVLVADTLGRGRVYAMTTNEASVFADRWLEVMTEEAGPVLQANLANKLREWQSLDRRVEPDQAQTLALWFRQARTVLGNAGPGPEEWLGILSRSSDGNVWAPSPEAPGLLGDPL